LTDEVAKLLQAELLRELSPGHPLFGKELSSIGRRTDCDDVLFQSGALPGVFVVQLTFSGQAEPPPSPYFEFFRTMDRFINAELRDSVAAYPIVERPSKRVSFRGECSDSENVTSAISKVFTLSEPESTSAESFFDSVRNSLPLDPPSIGSSWDALADSLFEGLSELDDDELLIVWPNASALATLGIQCGASAEHAFGGIHEHAVEALFEVVCVVAAAGSQLE